MESLGHLAQGFVVAAKPLTRGRMVLARVVRAPPSYLMKPCCLKNPPKSRQPIRVNAIISGIDAGPNSR